MNGEHPHSGRDLPLPGNGNGHGNTGQATGSPGYMSEERQPHIPALNSGGPRPPTPAGAMPQMMPGDRMQGPSQLTPSSGPGHARSSRGRPQSPAPEGPGAYARPGSPSVPHPSNGGHSHDSPYPQQHPYGHGPPPPHNIMHGGPPPQGYERQDQGVRTKQEQPPLYQHHRQRSGDLSRSGLMEDGHGAPHPQRHHHSDPHAHAPSPPRDDRRPPLSGSGPGYSHQSQQPPHHSPEDRWAPSSGPPGRHMSDDQNRDGGSRPPSSADRQGLHHNSSMADSYQGRNDRAQPSPHSIDPERRDQRPPEHHNPSFSRPGSQQGMREIRNQGSSYEDQQQQGQSQGQGQNQVRGRDFDSSAAFPEQGRGPSNWSAQDSRAGGYKTEDQDQDEIAASLVSLSGKAPPGRASGHSAQDDDYEMREPEQPTLEESRNSLRDDENRARHVHEQSQQQQALLHEDQSPYDAREQHPTSRPGSLSRQHHEQSSEQQRVEHGSTEIETNEDPSVRASSPKHGFVVASGDQGRAPPLSSPRDTESHSAAVNPSGEAPRAVESSTVTHEEFAETSLGADSSTGSGLRSGSGSEEAKDSGAVSNYSAGSVDGISNGIQGNNNSTSSIQTPVGAASESGGVLSNSGTGTGTGESSAGATGSEEMSKRMSLAVAEDEDTEMEEGEVREDEDEVMSSGAVPTVAQSKEPLPRDDGGK